MRETELDPALFLGNYRRGVRISSWLYGTLLAERVPVLSAQLDENDGQQVPERLTLSVPARDRGVSWVPGDDPEHALARYGQRLDVTLDVSTPRGQTGEIAVGQFPIQSWDLSADESTVEIVATGLLQVVADDKLPAPDQPVSGGTFKSEVERLMTGGVAVSFDLVALSDRTCPRSFEWEDDRLGALYDLADAWPARILTSPTGVVQYLAPLPDLSSAQPVATLTDGVDGVLMSAPQSDTRDGVYNVVTATSSADDSQSRPVSATYVTTTGPYSVETYGLVRRRYASPLLGTQDAAYSAARKIALDSQRTARTISVTLPFHPLLQRGDIVRLVWGEREYVGVIASSRGSLTVSSEPMQLDVGVIS